MKQWMIHLSLVETDRKSIITPLGDHREFINIDDSLVNISPFAGGIIEVAKMHLHNCFDEVRQQVAFKDSQGNLSAPLEIHFNTDWAKVMHGSLLPQASVEESVADNDVRPDEPDPGVDHS